jgi:hypothetical protein
MNELDQSGNTQASNNPAPSTAIQDYWNSLFTYCEDGTLLWKEHQPSKSLTGQVAGSMGIDYPMVKVKGVKHLCSKVVYEMHHGSIPPNHQVANADRDSRNNQVANLFLIASDKNWKCHSTKAVPLQMPDGISFRKNKQRWYAHFPLDGKLIGKFQTYSKAVAAQKEALA